MQLHVACSSSSSSSSSSLALSIAGSAVRRRHIVLRRLLYYDTIRYDTSCYFNVRSKADMSQLNLPHGNRQLKSVKQKKIKCNNGYAQSEVSANSPRGIRVINPEKEEREATVGRVWKKVRLEAWNEGVRGDGILIIISMNVSSILGRIACIQRAVNTVSGAL